MLKSDPTIDEIRRTRNHLSEECEHNPKKMVERYIQIQQKYKSRLLETEKQKDEKDVLVEI